MIVVIVPMALSILIGAAAGIKVMPRQALASRYRRRSCLGWYQADRQPGAWQCTTRWPTDQPPRLGKEGLAKAGKIR
jgi:hypothetical protein